MLSPSNSLLSLSCKLVRLCCWSSWKARAPSLHARFVHPPRDPLMAPPGHRACCSTEV